MNLASVELSIRGGGGGVRSAFVCRDTILKKASYVKNYRSEGGKSIHV